MFYEFLYPLHLQYSFFNVFQYLTFRTFGCLITAMLIYFIIGPGFIRWLKSHQFRQVIRDDGPQEHYSKTGTPTMGGLLILASVALSTLLWMNFDSIGTWLCLGVFISFGFIGLADDLNKISHSSPKGLKGRFKLLFQIILSLIAAYLMYISLNFDTQLSVPFFKAFRPDLGWFYFPFAVLVLVGSSNAVNLTDGLDGLATAPSIIAFASFAFLAYLAGHSRLAGYLQIPYIPGIGELAIFAGAVAGACIGFLWFNTHPAEVFMGDVGSLPLGAGLGILALMTKNELLLVIIGGIFVMEAISVITQVASFKLTGKRIFQMAPIHHHFELKGWKEPKIIVRFWIIAFILALISLTTLKLR